MNLKEAFRYEKYLTRLFNEGIHWLESKPTFVFYDHKRSAAYPKHQDETYREHRSAQPEPDNDLLLDFLLDLLVQKQHLGEAIRTAKKESAGSIDSEMQLNSMRRYLYQVLQSMLENRPRFVVNAGDGTGYYLAEDGTQKEYHYDVVERTVLNFNREKFGEKATNLIRQAEKVSSYIERQLLLVQVDYDPPYPVYCNLYDAVEQFETSKKAAG